MSKWFYITQEQGTIIDNICDQYFDHLEGDSCQRCPLFPACNDISIHCMEEPERTKAMEQKMWELAKENES